MRHAVGWGIALALAGCGDAATPVNAITAEPSLSPFQNAVVALDPAQRNGVFIRAIRDAGHDCQGVTDARRQDQPGNPMYVARCSDGATYGVTLSPDGTANVTGANRR